MSLHRDSSVSIVDDEPNSVSAPDTFTLEPPQSTGSKTKTDTAVKSDGVSARDTFTLEPPQPKDSKTSTDDNDRNSASARDAFILDPPQPPELKTKTDKTDIDLVAELERSPDILPDPTPQELPRLKDVQMDADVQTYAQRSKSPSLQKEPELTGMTVPMLPPKAEKIMQGWIRSRHLICSGNFFIFETVEYSTVERLGDCLASLGGTLIEVKPSKKVWIGSHRRVVLYRAKASLHTPHHDLKQYWVKYGGFYSRFDERG